MASSIAADAQQAVCGHSTALCALLRQLGDQLEFARRATNGMNSIFRGEGGKDKALSPLQELDSTICRIVLEHQGLHGQGLALFEVTTASGAPATATRGVAAWDKLADPKCAVHVGCYKGLLSVAFADGRAAAARAGLPSHVWLWCYRDETDFGIMAVCKEQKVDCGERAPETINPKPVWIKAPVLFQTEGDVKPEQLQLRVAYKSSGSFFAGVQRIFCIMPDHALVTEGTLEGSKWVVSGPLSLGVVYEESAINA